MTSSALTEFCRALDARDVPAALALVSPEMAHARVRTGARRGDAVDHWMAGIGHYRYQGDTALHLAAAGDAVVVVEALLREGAAVDAANRHGARPLHYAADGDPRGPHWDPEAQATTVAALIRAGADPDAVDKRGVTALHRAVRCRCASAVAALLAGGADPTRPNRTGSTPLLLATRTTGRGGSGSPEAVAQQREIIALLTSS